MIERLRERLILLDRDSESGAAMVEFAVVFPMQLILTLALIQFAFLAHAHMVVQQAAFMAARAAAVADGISGNANPNQAGIAEKAAATRVAARTLSVLAVGVTPAGGAKPLGTQPELDVPTDFRWRNGSAEGGRQVAQAKQDEVYALLSLEMGGTEASVGVTVEYDYVMAIPVASWLFNAIQGIAPDEQVKLGQGYYPWRIRRKAYIATPWRAHPSTTSSVAYTAEAVGAVKAAAVDALDPDDPAAPPPVMDVEPPPGG